MFAPGIPNIGGGGPNVGYQITRSLRTRSSATGYLNRTFGSPTDNTKWTLSVWVKRGTLGATQGVFNAVTDSNNYTDISFDSSDRLTYFVRSGGADHGSRVSNQVFRDPSSWYHVVVSKNGTTVTLYVNNQTLTLTGTAPTASDVFINSNRVHYFANRVGLVNPFDGYSANLIFVDGQVLTPSSFAQTDATTGAWVPIQYSGAFGINGQFCPFTDTSSTANLVKDTSGNGNNWTPNGISLSAGSNYDSVLDVPYCAGQASGTQPSGNYAVLNQLWKGSASAISNGGLTNTFGGSASMSISTMPFFNGKYYAEFTNTAAYASIGMCILADNLASPVSIGGGSTTATGLWEAYDNGGGIFVSSDGGGFGASLGATRFLPAGTIQFAADATNGKFWIGRNNTWYDSSFGTTGDPANGLNPTFTISTARAPFNIGMVSSAATNACNANFGQQTFSFTPPSGFVALCAPNLSVPSIKKGSNYFDVLTFTGVTGGATVTGLNFQPDLLWPKCRSVARNHEIYDSVRGVGFTLFPNLTNAELNDNRISSFNSNGFTYTSTSNLAVSGDSEVAWCMKKGATSGLDIVTYTGTGVNRTVNHSLGIAPSLIIVKGRSGAIAPYVYSAGAGAGNYLSLNTTNGSTADATVWNSTAPTSSVFSLGTNATVNGNTATYVAWLFAEIPGFSRIGTYTGNAAVDGTFIYLGFRPRFVMLKNLGALEDWVIHDSARDAYNAEQQYIYASSAATEAGAGTARMDFLANGIKLRNTGQDNQANTYIYLAFAENPFKYSNAR
jgi:hypothetical protein